MREKEASKSLENPNYSGAESTSSLEQPSPTTYPQPSQAYVSLVNRQQRLYSFSTESEYECFEDSHWINGERMILVDTYFSQGNQVSYGLAFTVKTSLLLGRVRYAHEAPCTRRFITPECTLQKNMSTLLVSCAK
eukprot:g40652.t1